VAVDELLHVPDSVLFATMAAILVQGLAAWLRPDDVVRHHALESRESSGKPILPAGEVGYGKGLHYTGSRFRATASTSCSRVSGGAAAVPVTGTGEPL
jgi:hypothetical protein